jgi:hypothetical protein
VSALVRALCRGVLLAAALLFYSGSANAAGTYTFCVKWTYRFTDQIAEDFLLHTAGQSTGIQPAAFALQSISRDGTIVRQPTYLGDSGCASVPAVAGQYTVTFQPAMKRSATWFFIYDNNTSEFKTFSWFGNLPGLASGTQTINIASAQFAVTNVAAVAALMLTRKHEALTANVIHTVYALQSCLATDPFSTCAAPSTMWLGQGDASRKFVIAHEMGHMLQQSMWGRMKADTGVTFSPEPVLCTCNNVTMPGDRKHCMQSLEYSNAAQSEGFAHFVAADLFNDKDQNDAFFSYYKTFTISENPLNIIHPPLWINISGPWRWMDGLCATDWGGVELDWLTFYYELNNRSANQFSFAEIRTVYRTACGNANCNSTDVDWSDVSVATEVAYGAVSAKTTYLKAQMQKHGVDSSHQ